MHIGQATTDGSNSSSILQFKRLHGGDEWVAWLHLHTRLDNAVIPELCKLFALVGTKVLDLELLLVENGLVVELHIVFVQMLT